MKQFIGIRFSRYGQVRIGTYENKNLEPLIFGQAVVVQTENTLSFGRVVWQTSEVTSLFSARKNEDQSSDGENNSSKNHPKTKNEFVENFEATQILNYIGVRPATAEELVIGEKNDLLGKEAHVHCKKCVRERELDIKLIDVEVLLDKSKIIFYFTAPTRIDFRELVKDLVREYRTRIELRQIGVRHETQMLGTLGNCGMVVCCRRYLKEFAPVTIKMAKEQNLFLNPAKISGMCGRLLCCLSYEQESYDQFHRAAPKLGKRYQTARGFLRVVRSNMFRNSVFVLNEAGQEEEVTLDDWDAMHPKRIEFGEGAQGTSRTNSPYDYMENNSDAFESDANLVGLLDEDRNDQAVKAVKADNTESSRGKPRHNPIQRPREKVPKRNSFDAETPNQQQIQDDKIENSSNTNGSTEPKKGDEE